jgi:hypothetical protein
MLRELAPQVPAALLRRHGYGQFYPCEDAAQETLLAAAVQWIALRPSTSLDHAAVRAHSRCVSKKPIQPSGQTSQRSRSRPILRWV